MEIKYNETKWYLIAQTDNFIAFHRRGFMRPLLRKKEIFDLCEEMLKQNYIPDFSQLNYYEVIFRKKKEKDNSQEVWITIALNNQKKQTIKSLLIKDID